MSTELASRIRSAREQRGKSQEQLARDSGVSGFTISRLERGVVRDPHASTLERVATALGTTSSFLMHGTTADEKASSPPTAA